MQRHKPYTEAIAMRSTNHIFAACLLILGIQVATPTLADNVGATPEIPATSAFGKLISDADLSAHRGGSALQITEMNLSNSNLATLSDNQASQNVTGSNYVTQNAFSGASGFPTVVQNSGNNVIIQNATIVNLSLH
jgi:hypothetical protein